VICNSPGAGKRALLQECLKLHSPKLMVGPWGEGDPCRINHCFWLSGAKSWLRKPVSIVADGAD
jgi:hypothetical protein